MYICYTLYTYNMHVCIYVCMYACTPLSASIRSGSSHKGLRALLQRDIRQVRFHPSKNHMAVSVNRRGRPHNKSPAT